MPPDIMHQTMQMLLPLILMRDTSTSETTSFFSVLLKVALVLLATSITPPSNDIQTYFKALWERICPKEPTAYTVKATINYKNNAWINGDISNIFKAIMCDLYEKITKDPKCTIKYRIFEMDPSRDLVYQQNSTKYITFDNNSAIYQIADNIKLNIKFKSKSHNSKNDHYTYDTYSMRLSSIDSKISSVMDYVTDTYEKYMAKKRASIFKTPKIFILSKFTKELCVPMFDVVDFKSTKSFSNMFFEQKKELLQKLDYFANERETYERLGIPHTLGFMFHGDPGTGKTSAIKAIAKYTNRHIIILPMKLLNNVEKLKKVFLSEMIYDFEIPFDKRLYVFEEIDCSHWRNILTSRSDTLRTDTLNSSSLLGCSSNKLKNQTNPKEESTEEKAISLLTRVVAANTKEEDLCPLLNDKFDLCLGEILELLDGIVEIPGRMMIMTSNFPERIDEALLRPGRIDMIINFKRMTRSDIASMYELWFRKNIPSHILANMKDYVFTQAELGNLFSRGDETIIHAKLSGGLSTSQ